MHKSTTNKAKQKVFSSIKETKKGFFLFLYSIKDLSVSFIWSLVSGLWSLVSGLWSLVLSLSGYFLIYSLIYSKVVNIAKDQERVTKKKKG